MNRLKIVAVLVILTTLASCSSYKKIPYFQDQPLSGTADQKIDAKGLTIQPADILAVNVTSKNPEAATLFNYNLTHVNGSNMIAADNPVMGYLVDDKGAIHLPLIGKLPVAGMTTSEVREKINTLLLTYYLDPVVNIRMINFKVAVYGDVLRPDVYSLTNERTTIMQVLTMAGDLNITARRDNVLLVRYEEGKRKMIRLDLTSKQIFDSPYFTLKNNDEIYIQPDRTKFATIDRGNRSLTILLSALSTLAIIFTAINR